MIIQTVIFWGCCWFLWVREVCFLFHVSIIYLKVILFSFSFLFRIGPFLKLPSFSLKCFAFPSKFTHILMLTGFFFVLFYFAGSLPVCFWRKLFLNPCSMLPFSSSSSLLRHLHEDWVEAKKRGEEISEKEYVYPNNITASSFFFFFFFFVCVCFLSCLPFSFLISYQQIGSSFCASRLWCTQHAIPAQRPFGLFSFPFASILSFLIPFPVFFFFRVWYLVEKIFSALCAFSFMHILIAEKVCICLFFFFFFFFFLPPNFFFLLPDPANLDQT